MGNLVRKFKAGDRLAFRSTNGDVGRLTIMKTGKTCVVLSCSAPESIQIRREPGKQATQATKNKLATSRAGKPRDRAAGTA